MTGAEAAYVDVDDRGDYAVATAHGMIAFGQHEKVLDGLLRLADRQPRIVLDLTGVPLCDSTGLTVLVRVGRRTTAGGGWLRLVAPQPVVRKVLEITQLDRFIPTFDSVAAAVAPDV